MAQDEAVEIGLPARLERRKTPAGMEIIRKWLGVEIVFMTFFAVIWDGFLVFWYDQAGRSGNLMLVLFPLIHVAVGVGVSYYAFIGWFNCTRIVFSPQKLAVIHGPFPWPGNLEINARTLKQLYTRQHVSRSRNGTSVTYAVHAITRDGKTRKILGGLSSSEQALYLEQEIEKFLDIEDKPVRGEYGR